MSKTASSAELYKEYMKKVGDRFDLFKLLRDEFNIESAIYPGSHIDITPSFFYHRTIYIDMFKKAGKFFSKPDLLNYIRKSKRYKEEPSVKFYFKDYREEIKEITADFDLLISLYAGIVSKYCKKYLRKDGLLLVNNSHADAGIANLDPDFRFYGVIYHSNRKLYFSQKNLDAYFIPKKETEINPEKLEKTMKGIGYTKTAYYYLFKKK
jgi:hypothetical protein